ncbi:MAG: hypothetical protein WDZ49_14565 [Litorilinea sp.]
MKTSGTAPFTFAYRDDFRNMPAAAQAHEAKLHGGFAQDTRPGQGELYYGLVDCGIVQVSADLTRQAIIDLPPELRGVNFHSTRLATIEGKPRLVLAANLDARVVVVGLDGQVDFELSRPEFEEYADAEQPFKPTDSALVDSRLYVADGYGSNYISTADPVGQMWRATFGGKTEDPTVHGRFGTAHGMNIAPDGAHLTVADRLHARLELFTFDGEFRHSFALPAGCRPCGIDYTEWDGRVYAAVGSLDDPDRTRSAPIYILDGATHTVISTIRPKEELGIDLADHIHNVVWHKHNGGLHLVCQSWNPGCYFVLELQ